MLRSVVTQLETMPSMFSHRESCAAGYNRIVGNRETFCHFPNVTATSKTAKAATQNRGQNSTASMVKHYEPSNAESLVCMVTVFTLTG